jgi:hypothetical protein
VLGCLAWQPPQLNQKQGRKVIATNPTAAKRGDSKQQHPTSKIMEIKAVAGYKVLSTETIDGKEVKTYGAKVWMGQPKAQEGDLVECLNWKGQGSIQRLVEHLEDQDQDPDFLKGAMGYQLWAIEPIAKRK